MKHWFANKPIAIVTKEREEKRKNYIIIPKIELEK